MENASKALIMAGGVLISIIIISAVVMVYSNMRQGSQMQDEALKAEQVSKFNMQYTSYEKNIRGVDLMSLINMAEDNNSKYDSDMMDITIEFKIRKSLTSSTSDDISELEDYTGGNLLNYNTLVNDELKIFKRRVFRHVESRYNQITGRINYMFFEELIN